MPDESPVEDYIDRAVASLLQPPPDGMTRLLAAVWRGYLTAGAWPVLDYVESAVTQDGLDVQGIINDAPSVDWGTFGTYGSFWTPRGGLPRNPGDQVALTVLGTHLCGDHNRPYIDLFLGTLRMLAREFSNTPTTPTSPRRYTHEWDLVAGESTPELGLFTSNRLWLWNVVNHEPRPWLGGFSRDADTVHWDITGRILAFTEVETIEQYLTVLVSLIATPPPEQARAAPQSALSPPEAIDYLDTVWELKFGNHLFRWAGAMKTVELALPCSSSEEFRSRVAALVDLLNQIAIPGAGASLKDPSLRDCPRFG